MSGYDFRVSTAEAHHFLDIKADAANRLYSSILAKIVFVSFPFGSPTPEKIKCSPVTCLTVEDLTGNAAKHCIHVH